MVFILLLRRSAGRYGENENGGIKETVLKFITDINRYLFNGEGS